MKKILTPILAGTILIVSGCSTNNSLYQYPFKSAKIEYTIAGTSEGKSTLTIKGDKSVRESHIIFHRPTGDEKQDNLLIDQGQYIYSIDLNKKIGTMEPNPNYNILMSVDPSMRQETLTKLNAGTPPDQTSGQPLKSKGKETVAGQTCDDYDGGFGSICLWNGIVLKTNISIPDYGLTNNTIATSVQTNIDVPDSAFDVPEGITIQQVGINDSSSQEVKTSTAVEQAQQNSKTQAMKTEQTVQAENQGAKTQQ